MFRSTLWRAAVVVAVLSLGLAGPSHAQEAPQSESAAKCDSIGVTQNRSFLQICASKIPDVSGNYTGVVNDAFSGQGTITLSVQQKQKKITGLWSTSFPKACRI